MRRNGKESLMKILFSTCYDDQHLGLRYLASYMLSLGHDVRILYIKKGDSRIIERLDEHKTEGFFANYNGMMDRLYTLDSSLRPVTDAEYALLSNFVHDWRPDIVGLSARTPYNFLFTPLIRAIRRGGGPLIVCGGFGPTLNPEISLLAGADFVVRGEGEEAMRELAEAAASDYETAAGIKNTVYIKDGKIIINPMRPMVNELDAYPLPLSDASRFFLIDNDALYTHEEKSSRFLQNSWPVLASRGCCLQCSYCSGGNLRRIYTREGLSAPKIRNHSIEYVLSACEDLKDKGARQIYFADEFFVRPLDEIQYFFNEYKKSIHLPFFIHLPAEQLSNDEICDIVVGAGLAYTEFGVQSADEQFTKEVYNRNNNTTTILKAIHNLYDRHVFSIWNYIGGNILESDEIFEKNIEFAQKIPFDPSFMVPCCVSVSKLTLFPNVPITENYPQLLSAEYDTSLWLYRAQLLSMRNKVSADVFEDIRANDIYKKNPYLLNKFIHMLRRDSHHHYLERQGQFLDGKDVYFYGCGGMYNATKHYFSGCRAQRIIVDCDFPRPDSVDGIKTGTPAEILKGNNILPIVIFSSNAVLIARRLRLWYGQYSDLTACVIA
jgi:radical SAM superfamily enzyme YgiQ (UPF0313 family)